MQSDKRIKQLVSCAVVLYASHAWCQPMAADATARCSALLHLRLDDTLLSDAHEVQAGSPGGGISLPAHCLVHGEIHRHRGADGMEYGDRFELRMPEDWQGRLLFMGGGGLDGVINPAIGVQHPADMPQGRSALSMGYAVVADDGGHTTAENASFGSDPEARADYNYRSTKLVADVARQLLNSFYKTPLLYSYFQGCSNGGREGLKTAQLYPEIFDGVIAGAPAFRLTHAALAQAWSTDQLATIAPRADNGTPDLRRSLTAADLNLLTRATLAKCDALDGLKDGLIFKPEACHFDPQVLACGASQSEDCLSAEKIRVIEEIFAGPHDSRGKILYSNWPYDSGMAGEGWRAWITGSEGTKSINVLIFPTFFNGLALAGAEPPIDIFRFNFDTDPQRIEKSSAEIDATSTNWSAFRKRNAKLLLYTGVSDPVFSAFDLIRYYRAIEQANGGASDTSTFARLYLSPGMNHCGGGPALDNFDTLNAMQEWVEHGRAPQSILATGVAFPGRTRPLCPYPLTAIYEGHGDPEKSSSFACRQP